MQVGWVELYIRINNFWWPVSQRAQSIDNTIHNVFTLVWVIVAIAVVTIADFDLYLFKQVLIQKKRRVLHPLPPKMSIVG